MGKDQEARTEDTFGYMEELSKAYKEAFAKRLAKNQASLPEEKRDAIAKMQGEIAACAAEIGAAAPPVKKEFAAMIKESAEEVLHLLSESETPLPTQEEAASRPLSYLLTQCVILANRSLNLLTRHTENADRIVFVILSELSALYALAAIN